MPTITNPVHALTFGPLNLIGTDAELALLGYKFECLADETEWGNPVPIEQKITSWLQDGALISKTGDDNRDDMKVRIRITGTDSNKLALAEQALVLETGKQNLLTWTPPDGVGPPCVFSVVMSNLQHSMDDMGELRLQRVYTLVIQAEPFARAQDLVSVSKPAPTGTQTITSINDGTSTTGWAGVRTPTSNTASLATVGGAIRYRTSGFSANGSIKMTVTLSGLSVTMSGSPYVRVVIDFPVASGFGYDITVPPKFRFNGTVKPVEVQAGNVYWFNAGTTTLNTVSVEITYAILTNPTGALFDILIGDVSRSNVLGDQSTNRQLARTLEVAGSARTQANLAVEDSTNALGSVLVYTSPAVAGLAQPNLRQFRVGGTNVANSALVSGFSSDLSVSHSFDIPVSQLAPGGYAFMARVSHTSTTGTLSWSARSRQGSTSLNPIQTGTTDITLTATSTYQIAQITKLNLPPAKLGASGVVRVTLSGPSGMNLDEAWLFNMDTGRLTWVECGTAAPSAGGSSNRLWIDSPDIDDPVLAVYRGFASDRSDSFHTSSEQLSFMDHEFVPPAMNIFTVTTNAIAAGVTLSHYPRFHTHVAA